MLLHIHAAFVLTKLIFHHNLVCGEADNLEVLHCARHNYRVATHVIGALAILMPSAPTAGVLVESPGAISTKHDAVVFATDVLIPLSNDFTIFIFRTINSGGVL